MSGANFRPVGIGAVLVIVSSILFASCSFDLSRRWLGRKYLIPAKLVGCKNERGPCDIGHSSVYNIAMTEDFKSGLILDRNLAWSVPDILKGTTIFRVRSESAFAADALKITTQSEKYHVYVAAYASSPPSFIFSDDYEPVKDYNEEYVSLSSLSNGEYGWEKDILYVYEKQSYPAYGIYHFPGFCYGKTASQCEGKEQFYAVFVKCPVICTPDVMKKEKNKSFTLCISEHDEVN